MLIDNGPSRPPSSVYVHVPFCVDRCAYCAFATEPDEPGLHGALIDGLLAEAAAAPPVAALRTLYLGGGTPALLPGGLLERLVAGLRKRFAFEPGAEVTLEANPSNVSAESLAAWADLGVTRLSLGVQTFDDGTLRSLGRRHDADTSRASLDAIAARWRGSWSADLLVGWHGQARDGLLADTRALLSFDPPHVSIYGLTVEERTPLERRSLSGVPVVVDADVLAAFDDSWSEELRSQGLERYEVSNFARPGHRSRHNQVYWRSDSHVGIGPGATTSVHPLRWVNRASSIGYLSALARGHGVRAACECLSPEARLVEVLAAGLRTTDGLDTGELDFRFGAAWRDWFLARASARLDDGLVRLETRSLRVPAEHLTRVDRILAEMLLPKPSPGSARP